MADCYNNLNELSPQVSQPKNITIPLMLHQLTSVYAMRKLEETGKLHAKNITQYGDPLNFTIDTIVGILADKVGAGKSLMIVALIELFRTAPERNFYWNGTKYISIQVTKNENLLPEMNTNLLIIPHKLVNQWKKFLEYAPDLQVDTFVDIKDDERIKKLEDMNNKHVIIIPCTKAADFFKKFGNAKWSRIIIDEADTIGLGLKNDFNANFIWLMTATPKTLRYSSKYFLSNIFKSILPWTFEYLVVKNDNEFIEKSIVLEPPKRIIIKCLTPKEIKVIQNFIPSNVLNMINAGNTEEAIKTLNFNVSTSDNILKVITRNLTEAINNKKLELEYENKKIAHGPKQIKDKEDIIKKITLCIQRLETRYASIKEKIHTLNDQYCPICMDEFSEKPTLVNCCQSIYCFECITLASTQNGLCPYCKKKIFKENMHVMSKGEKKDTLIKQSTEEREKLDVLIEAIQKTPAGKFLVFANFSKTLEKIEYTFKEKGIKYNVLKGSQKVVQKTLNDFSESKLQVILLNARFFGAGMNLEMATHLVLYHRFEHDLEEQVIGRAQRPGRKSQLTVIYLIHNNETSSFENSNTDFEDIDYTKWLEQLQD